MEICFGEQTSIFLQEYFVSIVLNSCRVSIKEDIITDLETEVGM